MADQQFHTATNLSDAESSVSRKAFLAGASASVLVGSALSASPPPRLRSRISSSQRAMDPAIAIRLDAHRPFFVR